MEKTRVLIVDDNKNLVSMVKEYFKNHGDIKITLSAYDGAEGMRIIENKKDEFDLILLDLIMPNKDGISVLEFLKEKDIDKKVIIKKYKISLSTFYRKLKELDIDNV